MRPSIILLSTFLLVGCATGPRYANTQTKDAATLVASDPPKLLIEVETIDGAMAPKAPLYLAPGFHHISISLSTPVVHLRIMGVGIAVEANKSYRIDAPAYSDRSFNLQIVDVTAGVTVLSKVVSARANIVTDEVQQQNDTDFRGNRADQMH